ncbi:MAG: M56 family metallopeptidase, partial [Sphingomonadales bacterium]|nr:M56 family metallopeptidase [Sphingomonadales bacterium]
MIDWLTGTLIATTVLMALVLIVRAPVARMFGARIAYALWLIPAARLFMPSLTRTIEVPGREAAPSALSPETLAVIAAAQAEPASFDWTALALTVWIGGAAMLFLWRMASYIQQREDI